MIVQRTIIIVIIDIILRHIYTDIYLYLYLSIYLSIYQGFTTNSYQNVIFSDIVTIWKKLKNAAIMSKIFETNPSFHVK